MWSPSTLSVPPGSSPSSLPNHYHHHCHHHHHHYRHHHFLLIIIVITITIIIITIFITITSIWQLMWLSPAPVWWSFPAAWFHSTLSVPPGLSSCFLPIIIIIIIITTTTVIITITFIIIIIITIASIWQLKWLSPVPVWWSFPAAWFHSTLSVPPRLSPCSPPSPAAGGRSPPASSSS